MLRPAEDIFIECNFMARLLYAGTKREVPGSRREAHNVFTDVGRDWLAQLVVWNGIGTGPGGSDEPVTNRRLRWMGVGTGATSEVESVAALDNPVEVDDLGNYLAPLQNYTFPEVKRVRVYKEFGPTEISTVANPVVGITEAGLFVDVIPVSSIGGSDDSAVGLEDSTLNRTLQFNAPVAYKTFDVINKTQDFSLEIQWELRF